MPIETDRHKVVLLTGLLGLTLLSPAIGVTTAQTDSQTAGDYFTTLREMDNLSVLDTYGELETVHTQSLTDVQVGEFTDDQARELDYVIATLRSFQTAQDRFEAGEYEASLDAADNVESNISQLERQDQSLAALSELALIRYYERVGDEVAAEAETTNSTREEIRLRGMAADSYRRANNPSQASEYTRQVERLNAELAADREQINASQASMNEFENRCNDCESVVGAITTHHIGVFGLYGDAIKIEPRITDSVGRASKHGLDDRQSTLTQQSTSVTKMRSTLAVAGTGLLIAYGCLIALMAMLVASRLFVWKQTYEYAQVDSVVVMGDSNV